MELLRVLDHPVPAIGRDDAEATPAASLTLFRFEKVIAPGWNAADLVVVEVGDDEGLGGERALDLGHVAAVDAALVHPRGVGSEVLADRAHRQGSPPSSFKP